MTFRVANKNADLYEGWKELPSPGEAMSQYTQSVDVMFRGGVPKTVADVTVGRLTFTANRTTDMLPFKMTNPDDTDGVGIARAWACCAPEA